MSVQRSPQGRNVPEGQSCSQSQPDLSTICDYDAKNNVNCRKRKERECCDVLAALKDFRAEMISILQTNLKPMRDDISTMKDQINDIKSSTNTLLTEHKNLQEKVSILQENCANAESKISTLELEIENIKSTTPKPSTSDIFAGEKIISELQERNNRSKNVIMIGLPEQTLPDNSARQTADVNAAQTILQNVVLENPKVVKAMRLGKYSLGKNRPLKICFNSSQEAKEIFQNKNKVPSNIKLYSDQTPTQKNIMKELSQELARRKENGEKDLIIKYISGTPKIVEMCSKNLNP